MGKPREWVIYIPGAFSSQEEKEVTGLPLNIRRALTKVDCVSKVTDGMTIREIVSRTYGKASNRGVINQRHVDYLYYRVIDSLRECDFVFCGINCVENWLVAELVIAARELVPTFIYLSSCCTKENLCPLPFYLPDTTIIQTKETVPWLARDITRRLK